MTQQHQETHHTSLHFVTFSVLRKMLNNREQQNRKWDTVPVCLETHFDMKLQVFIHGIDVVKDILHYPGDDAHWICVMEIPLHTERQNDWDDVVC